MATTEGKAGQSFPWTDRSEGTPGKASTEVDIQLYWLFYPNFKIKKTVGKLNSLSLSTV